MPRSSGQYPIPNLATWYVGMPITSWPLTLIEPVRLLTKPKMDRKVVVRPAPLRPKKQTTSPFSTVRLMP